MQKVNINDIGGITVKDDSTYTIKDNKFGSNLVVSSTFLRAGKETSGHRHEGQEEVYHFIKGNGKMEVDHRTVDVGPGDVILVEDGEFHKVFNTGHLGLYFVCVFNGTRSH